MNFIIGIIASYLIGSIPTAYIYGKLYRNIDIRQHGSGNIGATNVFRVLGKWPGIIVLSIDILKGLVPAVIISPLLKLNSQVYLLIMAVAVVCGHNWTCFLKFKGGKGIATSFGALIGLMIKIAALRAVVLLTALSWLIIFLASGFVSLASMSAAILLPVFMLVSGQDFEIIIMGVVFCIFVIYRHKTNMRRLLSGQEHRVKLPIGKKPKHQ